MSSTPVAAGSVWPPSRWHYRRSLASRVILLTTIAVGLAVAIVALAVFVTVRIQMQSTLDESLLNRAKQAASSSLLANLSSQNVPPEVLGAADVRIIFITPDGAFSVDSGHSITLGKPEYDVADGRLSQSVRTVVADGQRYRVAAVPDPSFDGQALVLAQSLAPQERVLDRLAPVMLLFGLAGVIAAGAAGWAVARNGLRPVRRLTTAVEQIARTEQLAPLPVEGDDEIARLATAFNAMLLALAASRDRQRRLVADAGHELRTPLTSLRTNLELLTQADAQAGDLGGLPPHQRAELLGDVRAQLEELSTLVGDLVELARDEPLAHAVEGFDLSEVVDRAVSRVRLRAPRVRFDVSVLPWYMVGETGAIERAVTNLLDNAAKWGPPDGTVAVGLANGVLTVDDQGPGIDPADLPHVFERFYRSRESRSMPGSGLGLAIVHQVVERHAGSVYAGSAPGGHGARFTLWLPGSPEPPQSGHDATSADELVLGPPAYGPA